MTKWWIWRVEAELGQKRQADDKSERARSQASLCIPPLIFRSLLVFVLLALRLSGSPAVLTLCRQEISATAAAPQHSAASTLAQR
jgi:hypothetical protein